MDAEATTALDPLPTGTPPVDTQEQAATGKTIIVHAAYPLWRKHTLVTLARAKELQDSGNRVIVTYCNASAGTCAVNYGGSPVACLICKMRVTRTAASMGLEAVPLATDSSVDKEESPLPFHQQRALVEGVQSGVISTFRTLPEQSRRSPMIGAIKQIGRASCRERV